MQNATDSIVIKFLEENIITIFGFPHKIIIDNAHVFSSNKMKAFCENLNIKLGHSTTYYPQGNGLVKSSNKNLMKIIKKIVQDKRHAWDSILKYALWADRCSVKRSTGLSPFELFYGREVIVPLHLTIPIRKILQEN